MQQKQHLFSNVLLSHARHLRRAHAHSRTLLWGREGKRVGWVLLSVQLAVKLTKARILFIIITFLFISLLNIILQES